MKATDKTVSEVSRDLCHIILTDDKMCDLFCREKSIVPEIFDAKFMPIVKAAKDHWERSNGTTLLTRRAMLAWSRKQRSNNQQIIANEMAFNKAFMVASKPGDYFWLLDVLKERANRTKIANRLADFQSSANGQKLGKGTIQALQQNSERPSARYPEIYDTFF